MNLHIHPSDDYWDDIEETAINIYKSKTMKETNILIRIDSDLKQKFKDYADSKGKTMTEILTEFIKSKG